MYLYWIIFLTTVVIAEQPIDYQNNFNIQRYNTRSHESEVISSTPVKVDLINPEDLTHQKEDTRRGSRTFSYEEVEDDGSYDGSLVDTIPGKAGKDYPSYSVIPKTGFSCTGKAPAGYFADVETDCQVFHICLDGGQKISFLCPNGSIFNQKVSVCDWWYDVDCPESYDVIEFNDIQREHREHVYHEPDNSNYQEYQHFIVEETYDLNLASSGGNQHPKQQKDTDGYKSKNNEREEANTENHYKKMMTKKKIHPSSDSATNTNLNY